MGPHYLEHLFMPQSVAVFGASELADSVAGQVYRNLLRDGFAGPVYPVNPKYSRLGEVSCYPDIAAVPGPVDMAVIGTPAATVPEILHQCGEHNVRAAVILSAGFSEDGEPNALQQALLQQARQYNIRLLGPNCLGLIRPRASLNATFSNNRARRGNLALISQSGALCTAVLDWAEQRNIGFSAVISLGDAADIDFGSMLDYLALDPETRGILLYVEGVRDARGFMSGLRSAARMKPVVVLKVGRHQASAQAALSHTGSLVGSNDVFDAALQRAGAVRVHDVNELFAIAQLLANQHRVNGNRLAIVTNGGGPGIMATDRALDLGIELAELTPQTREQLRAVMPAHWTVANPVDVLGDAPPARYRAAVQLCLHDPGVDGVLVLLTPQAMTHPETVAQQIIDIELPPRKTMLTCWMGQAQVETARQLFAQHKIPGFTTPESAVEAFAYLVAYYRNQQLLLQVPGPLRHNSEPDIEGARMIIDVALSEQRHLLSRSEANAVLSAFAIPVMPVSVCRTANEALVAAESLGFPVAMKINSPDIAHKTDVDGVRLNITNAQAVRSSFRELLDGVQRLRPQAKLDGVTVETMYHKPHGRELMAGVVRDPVFGPVITFGAGGTMLEFVRDRATALPPLNTLIIDNMISQTRVSRLLLQFRNQPPVDRQAIIQLLRRLSEMVCELPQIRELDINPFVVNEDGAVVLDARIVVDPYSSGLDSYAHMAIHPYPVRYTTHWQLADGTDVVSRPIRPEDADIETAFIARLSAQSKYFRFMRALQELTPEMLVRFTQIDYDREMALIAVLQQGEKEIEIAVARYITNPDATSCEFAIVVADEWTKKGIGSQLLRQLMAVARARGLQTMEGEVLSDNRPMLDMARVLGFSVQMRQDDPGVMWLSTQL
ncbi:MAG: bifunctional acetate--CoA ligase family protein/GNAT family N-acetyltransferase [Gammaproteobacteria bacterium]|jgi:acetyltransferase